MILALVISIAVAPGARELEAAKRASALLRFVARIEERESGEAARHEQAERRAAAGAILDELALAAPAQAESARRLGDAVRAQRSEEVARLAGKLQRSVERGYRWEALPARPPDLARGARLYAQSCAVCHGRDGRPPPENPLELSTPPVSFVDPEPADLLSPRRIFDAITAGIPESAMPSFDGALAEPDRWSIAFYVQALRHARPAVRASSPGLSLEDAALASDALLRARLEALGTTPSEIERALAQARWNPPRRRATARLPLVVPGFLTPVELRSEVMDEQGARIDLVLQRPSAEAQKKLLYLMNLIARQAMLRAPVPLTALSVNLFEDERASDPIARCTLVTLGRFQCGVAPPNLSR